MSGFGETLNPPHDVSPGDRPGRRLASGATTLPPRFRDPRG